MSRPPAGRRPTHYEIKLATYAARHDESHQRKRLPSSLGFRPQPLAACGQTLTGELKHSPGTSALITAMEERTQTGSSTLLYLSSSVRCASGGGHGGNIELELPARHTRSQP
jgi:hypothetical protein